jgi:hypothetical protein
VTDSGSPTPQTATTSTVSGTIAPATLTLASTASAVTKVGQAYSQTNVASGGTTPYTYSVSSGALPAGVTLSASTGTVSGTPTTAGAFSYTIKATDSGTPAQTATQVVSGTIAPATLTLAANGPTTTKVGRIYSQTNAASGGTTPYTYSVSSSALPAGTALNVSTGKVSGMLHSAAGFSYSIKVTDSGTPPQTATAPTTVKPPVPVYQGIAFVTAVNGGATNACILNGIRVGDYYTTVYRSGAEAGNTASVGGLGFYFKASSVALDLAAGASLSAGHSVQTITAQGQSSLVGPFATRSTFDLNIAPDPLLATTPWVTISGTVADWGFNGCAITLRGSLTLRPQ